MHNYPEYWTDPEVYRPERFNEKSTPYTYYPFLLGPRQCIGKNFAILELKCIIGELLKRTTVTKDPAAPEEIMTKQAFLTLSINNKFLVSER